MKKGSETNSGVQTTYLRGSGAMVTMGDGENAAATVPVKPAYSDELESSDYQPWGPNNDEPKIARLKVEKSSTAFPLIHKRVEMMFGRGLFYYKEKKDENGKLTFEFPEDPEINEFLLNNDANYLMLERMMDYVLLNNCFAEFIKQKSNSKIVRINHLEAEFTRFGAANEKTQEIAKIQYLGDWESGDEPESIDFISRRNKTRDEMLKFKKKFATHSCFPSPGRTLYAKSASAALYRDKGWLDYANSVPEIMNSINNNAMNIKYHIQIPDKYWKSVNKDWDSLDQSKREKFIGDKLDEMDKWLSGKENSHKSFISHFSTDMQGKKLSGWEITAIDDKSKKDAYLTSLQEADTHISRSFGIDPSLSGIQAQSSSMGAGSGSDKRVGFQNTISMSHASLYVITEPLRVVQMYNGWDPDIKWGFWHDVPTTLNEDSTGTTSKL